MESARQPSITGTYDARLQRYYRWCRMRDVDPTTASVVQLAEFLQELFDSCKFLPSTIAGYRTAIKGFNDTLVSQIKNLKEGAHSWQLGMSQLRPPERKLLPNLSLPLVLNRLLKEPFEPL